MADYWIVKLNGQGIVEWDTRLGGSLVDVPWDVELTTDGGYIVAGYSASTDGDVTGNHGGYDYWVVKIDAAGDLVWEKSLGGTDNDRAISISQTTDGGFILTGYSNSSDGDISENQGSYDGWTVKLDNDGNLQWEMSLGGSKSDNFRSIAQTSDGGYVMTGWINSNDSGVVVLYGDSDFWVVKFGAETLGLATNENNDDISVHPNPVSETLYISTKQQVEEVKLYDMLGKQIFNSNYRSQIDVSRFQSGVYVLKLITDQGQFTKRILINQ
ncbi:T9SS type A sorting domain-containing protein [Subsaximicrobium wynnwilliamsii]|uniref:T9SS type A sorting domain-containing protein n=1 Tax=Subsaximicrobium wynnwilliamsii TaxID=291179 RepID=A0A5C6ZGD5_9FLAO|nr:T9SS type A sorting domain-containing protein [Subsaximicrobium wynnwilliamsii]TXD82088.1 T9SS type A sorting domain-containing protein [Subsaximicrobium wynnwilliamsii]TXD87733.1 T9SS type A sorting domain-containing protein [Subsaximicrobium wynnwilliamsii]TXE01544.1 T9SS type A sorting domain-containing protein [Subsaximicrobium wynnwilliamsii]